MKYQIDFLAKAELEDKINPWRNLRKGKSNLFDLPSIASLLEFNDCDKYMNRLAGFVPVSANNPLYEVRISDRYKNNVVFTRKLAYYVALSDSVVNQSMNDVFAQLDAIDKVGGNVQAMVKQTGNAIKQIFNWIKEILDDLDTDKDDDWKKNKIWNNIIYGNPDICVNEFIKEFIAFYHYMTAQMCRYWFELKSRYGNGASVDEVRFFYSEDLHILPDTGIIDIVPADKPEKPTAECKEKTNTEKKPATPKKEEEKMRRASFIINEKDSKNRDDTATALFNILCNKYSIIHKDYKRAFTCLLSGGTSSKPIHWRREYKVLLGLFLQDMHAIIINKYGKRVPIMVGERDRIDKEKMQRFVTVSKEGASFWEVVYEWFVDEDGNYYEPKKAKLKDATFADKWADILVDLHRALLSIDKKQDPPKFR